MTEILNAEKLSIIRRYPTEILVLLLLSWCGYMQVQLTTINKEKEKYFIEDRQRVVSVLEQSNLVIAKNNLLFEELLKNGVQQNNIPQQSGSNTSKGKP
jgi:hypothetical protein